MKLAGVLLGLLFSSSVLSQPFPQKPVRIVVPFRAGGDADALARLMAPKLVEFSKQQVLIENKPGASGCIGADLVELRPAVVGEVDPAEGVSRAQARNPLCAKGAPSGFPYIRWSIDQPA